MKLLQLLTTHGWLHFALRLSLLLLGCWWLFSIIWRSVKKYGLKRNKLPLELAQSPLAQWGLEKPRVTNMVSRVLLFVLGCACGWFGRDVLLSSRTQTYEHVQIIRQDSPSDFWVSYNGAVYFARFCPNFLPPFRAGLQLREITFTHRGECWDVGEKNLGYTIDRGSEKGEYHGEQTQAAWRR